MASARQIAANRRNAEKCTGPKTDAGKAASRFNGLKHGLTAATVVLPCEDQIEYQELRARVLEDFTPENALEWMLVDQLVSAWWRTMRSRKVESAHMEAHTKTLHWRHGVKPSRNEADSFQAIGVAMASHEEATFTNYNRYDAAIERAFYRASDRIQKIIERRKRDLAKSLAAPVRYRTAGAAPKAECSEMGLVSFRDVPAPDDQSACGAQSPPPHTMAA
jgi:hypothetical protein